MKLLFAQEYVERDLFIIEHKGKFISVYRSSGLNGTCDVGEIIPFMGLNERPSIYAPLGLLLKTMLYDGLWIPHDKNMSKYGLHHKMEQLKEFLKTVHPPKEFDFDDKTMDFKQFVIKTNNAMLEARGKLKPFDLAEEF